MRRPRLRSLDVLSSGEALGKRPWLRGGSLESSEERRYIYLHLQPGRGVGVRHPGRRTERSRVPSEPLRLCTRLGRANSWLHCARRLAGFVLRCWSSVGRGARTIGQAAAAEPHLGAAIPALHARSVWWGVGRVGSPGQREVLARQLRCSAARWSSTVDPSSSRLSTRYQ